MLSKAHLNMARRPSASLVNIRRSLATEVTAKVEESEEQQRKRYEEFLSSKEKEPPLRPHLDVSVDPNHGLYAFFRRVPTEAGTSFIHETVESAEKPGTKMGRSWNATELRRKSFKDLHTLWYIVLRERNLLATQATEARRLGVLEGHIDTAEKDKRCRKTMARIKQILNERRLVYERAYALDYATFKEREAQRAQGAKAQNNEYKSGDEAAPSASEDSDLPTRGRRLKRARKTTAALSTNPTPVETIPVSTEAATAAA